MNSKTAYPKSASSRSDGREKKRRQHIIILCDVTPVADSSSVRVGRNALIPHTELNFGKLAPKEKKGQERVGSARHYLFMRCVDFVNMTHEDRFGGAGVHFALGTAGADINPSFNDQKHVSTFNINYRVLLAGFAKIVYLVLVSLFIFGGG